MIARLKGVLALVGSLAFLGAATPSALGAEDVFKSLRLSRSETSGAAAVRALGNHLPAIAAAYGKSASELRQLLLRDKTLKVAPNGRLFYKEATPNLPRTAPPSDAINSGQLYPLDQTFSLHSRPGAPKVMVLRFRGATITGTYWNTTLKRTPIVAPAFDTDNAPATFSDAERTAIQKIWQRVAEDYTPFDVDVTTDDTTVLTSGNTASVVITRQRVFSTSSPGVAYTSTFGNLFYDPAFVAFDTLSNNDKYIAEAVSHELGHRLGLDHDGKNLSAYYAGQGSGAMRWAPIMGNSYTAPIAQFSKGEYSGANNLQDDYAVMTRFLAFRQDETGNTPGTAVPLPVTTSGSTTTGKLDGVLERLGDEDVYSITADAGPFSATVSPATLSPDTDLVLTLTDDTGTVIASVNPPTALSASVATTLPAGGTYYLKVGGTGYGNAAVNGYSNYGVRGNYRLAASYASSAITVPRAAITASTTAGPAPLTVTFNAATSTAITGYAWDFGNGYTASQPTATTRFDRAGRYTIQLKVTGAARFSNATALEIVVGKTFTANIAMVRNINPDGTVSVTARTSGYTDSDGRSFMANAIYGSWSGATSGNVTGTGQTKSGANFTSAPVRNSNACFTFTVTKVNYMDPGSAAGEQKSTYSVYYPAGVLSATSCPPQQASR